MNSAVAVLCTMAAVAVVGVVGCIRQPSDPPKPAELAQPHASTELDLQDRPGR